MPNTFPFIKIILGASNNSKTLICGLTREIFVNSSEILNENKFEEFLISWKFGTVTLAKFGRPHFIAYKLQEKEKFPIKFFSVCGFGERKSEWKIERT
jgi:hypothetical protein